MDEALLSSSSVGRDQLGEMIIAFEPHGIFGSNLHIYFNIVQPLVCKRVTRLRRASFLSVEIFE